jgi:hypothetical protein
MLNPSSISKSVMFGIFVMFLTPVPSPFSAIAAHLQLSPDLQAQRLRERDEPPPPPPSPAPAPTPPSAPQAQPASGPVPPSMLDQPPKPAQIDFIQGTLTIRADNASLDQILRSLAGQSGMKVEGFGQDERVFGSFGPGNPQDVLSDLLNGTSYNVLMVGAESDGAPSHLILTPATARTDAASTEPVNSAPVPTQSPSAFGAPQTAPQRMHSPQEMFQQMQAMHQRQQQQDDQPQ